MRNSASKRQHPIDVIDANGFFPFWEITRINIRHNALLSIAVSVVLLLLIPLLTGTANLDRNESAVPLEMFASLIGIIMLTPVFGPEQNPEINDLVSAKYVSTEKIYLVRTVYSILILTLLTGLFILYLGVRDCDVTAGLFLGTLSDAVFLGALGMITSALCNNTVIAYMIPMFFYALNYGMGNRLGNYYLFSMAAGDFGPKPWMFATGIALMAASVLYKGIQKKYR